jgi:hypothetical protein
VQVDSKSYEANGVAGPCAEGGESLDRGLLGELLILLASDVPVGELT